jgi:hypothetical protein
LEVLREEGVIAPLIALFGSSSNIIKMKAVWAVSNLVVNGNFFVLFCFVLFCFVLFCFVLFCFVLFCCVLFCFVLFCFVLFCFVLFCFVLFCYCLVFLLLSIWLLLLVVYSLNATEENQTALVEAGGLSPLVSLLTSGSSHDICGRVAWALSNLTQINGIVPLLL